MVVAALRTNPHPQAAQVPRRAQAAGNTVKKSQTSAKFFNWSRDAVIRVYDAAGNVIQAHENKGDFEEP